MASLITEQLVELGPQVETGRGVILPSGAPNTTLRFFFASLVTRQVPSTWGYGAFATSILPGDGHFVATEQAFAGAYSTM